MKRYQDVYVFSSIPFLSLLSREKSTPGAEKWWDCISAEAWQRLYAQLKSSWFQQYSFFGYFLMKMNLRWLNLVSGATDKIIIT